MYTGVIPPVIGASAGDVRVIVAFHTTVTVSQGDHLLLSLISAGKRPHRARKLTAFIDVSLTDVEVVREKDVILLDGRRFPLVCVVLIRFLGDDD